MKKGSSKYTFESELKQVEDNEHNFFAFLLFFLSFLAPQKR